MENYKSDEILKLEDQIALMEEKILKSFSRAVEIIIGLKMNNIY